jgi:hypothetical protein
MKENVKKQELVYKLKSDLSKDINDELEKNKIDSTMFSKEFIEDVIDSFIELSL